MGIAISESLRHLARTPRVARAFFGSTEKAFRALGLEDAADNLRHYRGATGKEKFFSDDQIAKHLPITEAEDRSRTNFVSRTFVGKTKNPTINNNLKSLRDGQSYHFQDDFQSNIFGEKRITRLPAMLINPKTYLAFGRGEIRSDGDFTATRKGNKLVISGKLKHDFDDDDADKKFDFDPGQPGHVTGRALEQRGEARPFEMRFDRRQTVDAILEYGPKGTLTLKKVKWGKVQ